MSKKVKYIQKGYRHRDCVHATDFYSLDYKGDPILCRCKYEQFSMLLSDNACITNFKL